MVLDKKILAISLLMVLICMCSVTFISAANAENVAVNVECIEATPVDTAIVDGDYYLEEINFEQEATFIYSPFIANMANNQLAYKSELGADGFAMNKNSVSYDYVYKFNDNSNDLENSVSMNLINGAKERFDIGFGILGKFTKNSAFLTTKTVSTDFNKVQALSTNVDFKVSTSTIAQGYNAMNVIGNTFVDSIANMKIKFSNPVIATEDIVTIPAAVAAVAEAAEAADGAGAAGVDAVVAGALGVAPKVAPAAEAADYTNAAAKKVADDNTEAMADALRNRGRSAATSIVA